MKKYNKQRLNEEIKKFRLLSEYSFYIEKEDEDDNLILGSKMNEQDPEDADQIPDGGPDVEAQDTPDNNTDIKDNPEVDQQSDMEIDQSSDNVELDVSDNPDIEIDDNSDEVELDITDLVKGNKEVADIANDANQKTTELINKFDDLERKVSSMDSLVSKIDNLEKEIIKRNPTNKEKLEMRSLDSYPYNVKLTDFWKDVDGYDVNQEEKEKEYILRQDDIQNSFTDSSIKNSFDVPSDYEEEDIF